MSKTERLKLLEQSHLYEVYPKRDVVIVRGDGAKLWDADGREFIDCTAGVGVANVGHANPAVVEAISLQAQTLITCPNIFYNDVRARLLNTLTSVAPTGLNRAFLCNSGAEAIEAALKFARLTTGRTNFVACMRGFHGRTMGAVSATFNKKYRQPFEPLVPGFGFVPLNNLDKLRASIDSDTAAVLIELVQGEGGVRPAESDFVAEARSLCNDNGSLLIVDEIQTGFCRTGRMFASEHHELAPDIMTVAKAMAGGVPMGAVLVNDAIADARGQHGTTFGGSPLACAAANAAINFMREMKLDQRAEQAGALFRSRFDGELPVVKEVRQIGLMIGIELSVKVQPLLVELLNRGVLALPAGPTVLRLLPPLVITDEEIEQVVSVLHDVLKQAE